MVGGQPVERDSPSRHDTPDIFKCGLVKTEFPAEVVTEYFLGYVIFCRAETACREDDVAKLHRSVYGAGYCIGIVGHSLDIGHAPPPRGHLPGKLARIGVDNLPYEQLVTYDDY